MTAADYLARVEALDKAAESGPWFLDTDGISIYYVFHNGDTLDRDRLAESSGDDARLIAAYRTAAPAMAAALRAVLDLHRPDMFGNCTNCETGPGWSMTHPCKTLEIIEKFLGDHDVQG